MVYAFAGRWQGALVAIKVVEHSLRGEEAELEGARESLLAASISHPNVVRLPKTPLAKLSDAQSACTAPNTMFLTALRRYG